MSSGPAESYPRLLGDIGGTNARFAWLDHPGASISHTSNLACADFPGPLEAIRAWLDIHQLPTPRHAALGLATPVQGDQVRFTNSHWSFSIEALRHALNIGRLVCMNDFTALALALPHLQEADRRQIGPGQAQAKQAIGLIGPGTGLGVSGLIKAERSYIPIAGEGGHVSLSPATDEELAITAILQRQYGHVSAERILSGPGLVTLYQALAQVRGQRAEDLDSARITAAALENNDALCAATLDVFCAQLGSAAGNLALTLGAGGGVYIGGGIVPRLGTYFDNSAFRARFEAKGRFASYLAKIPTWVITASQPALVGAQAALADKIDYA